MIDKVKGVVIEPNGIAHSFGKCRMTLDISEMKLMILVLKEKY